MEIDERIESRVRAAFGAAIGQDGDDLVAALEGLDEQGSQEALGLGLTVVEFVLRDAFGDEPTIAELSTEASEMREDLPRLLELVDQSDVVTFLAAVARGDTSLGGLGAKDVGWLTFVCGGYLLDTRGLPDQTWWEYLNEIWQAVSDRPAAE
ncbi:hypothetical protein GCM10023322_71800 [Rugosimonospora acidiphila]|uniref:Uncharacterized protein n=1 Tax=Rugosimonospora acidiphila TaxID=556531 RepID=A0ABP9SPQ4_9ACTN